jgi:hypothetical protein
MTKNYAMFKSSFPDDSVENDAGDVIIPAGLNLATAIAAMIPTATAPYQHSFYGWKVDFFSPSGRKAWALLQQPGPWLLIVEAKVGWFESRNKKAEAYADAVTLCQLAISLIDGITEVLWLTRDESLQRESLPNTD